MRAEVSTRTYDRLVVTVTKDGPNKAWVDLHKEGDYPSHELTPFAARILATALQSAAEEALMMDQERRY